MKKKLVNYFLIAAVILLWGIIIYRIVDARDGSESQPISNLAPILRKKITEDYSNHQDTTHLVLNYRDPFAVEEKKESKEIPIADLISKPPTTVNVPARPMKPVINWSFITYSGYIRNSSSKKLLAIIIINGREFMMAEGETNGEVKLLKNLKDSVKVSYEGKWKFIAMNTK